MSLAIVLDRVPTERPNAVTECSICDWNARVSQSEQEALALALENGQVLFLPNLAFELKPEEHQYLSTRWSNGKTKSIYLRGPKRTIAGAAGSEQDLAALGVMVHRFSTQAITLLQQLFPKYAPHLTLANTSFRPHAVETRTSSFRKDDRLLHVDAFPSNPTRGTRILRLFTNVNPDGAPREWRIGEPFPDMARQFLPKVPRYSKAIASLLQLVRLTKRHRSEYDHLMLHLHDLVKGDAHYQKNSPQQHFNFPPGSSWIVFSDQVLHAAMAGQYMMEQTSHLPVSGQCHPDASPLRVLESMTCRKLL